jgi:hypothetical protein
MSWTIPYRQRAREPTKLVILTFPGEAQAELDTQNEQNNNAVLDATCTEL